MKIDVYNDEVTNPPLKRHIGVMSNRARFLGMFDSTPIPPGEEHKAPRVGFLDHFIPCPGCGQHPVLFAICFYVKLGRYVHSVSWPTWLPVP